MGSESGTPIIITGGYRMHIPCTRIYHRQYPEARGEGASLADAAAHLARQLALSLECVAGREGRETIQSALAEVRALTGPVDPGVGPR